MFRLAIVNICATLALTAVAKAGTLQLVCSGYTDSWYGEHIHARVDPAAATLDTDTMVLKTSLGNIKVTKVTPQAYIFDTNTPVHLVDGTALHVSGSLDRISGKLSAFFSYVDNPNQLFSEHDLVCHKGEQQF